MGSVWKKVTLATTAVVVVCSAWITWNRVFEVEAEPRLTYKHMDGKPSSSNLLLEIPIYGEIMVDASDPSLFWSNEATYSAHIEKLLKQAGEDSRVKGILLRLNTGGGSATGSDAIYNALTNYRKSTQNPVVAYIEEESMSGGVMSMMGADAIYAAPGSNIGSIGVLGDTFFAFDGITSYTVDGTEGSITSDNGVERIVISAGKGKDFSKSYRKATIEERKTWQENVDDTYDRFVKLVSKSRNIPEKTIREKVGAYYFGNKQAEKLKLIDGTKSWDEAIVDLAKRAKIEDFRLVRAKEPSSGLPWNFGGAQTLTYEQKMQMLNRDRCSTARNSMLLYHGSMKNLCSPGN
ncbi:MAG: S49 family peptidase [Leptolyngbyaceae cyanobacterium bins.302]|nr:S49 family peptidase [Leptolyngbyaceae cyanobacterium bins.302]